MADRHFLTDSRLNRYTKDHGYKLHKSKDLSNKRHQRTSNVKAHYENESSCNNGGKN